MPNDSDNPLEPVTGSEMYHRALEKFEKGMLDAALYYADGALHLGHVDADICLLKAQILFELKQLDEALSWVDEAQAFNPLNVEVSFWRGRIFAAKRMFRRALGCYNRVLERDPHHGDAVMHRGIAFFELGETDRALAAFEQAKPLTHEHDEREAELLYWRAKLERSLGHVEPALKLLENALERHGQHIASYAELGDLLRCEARNNRDLRRARRIYERGLEIEPNDPALHNDYGNLLRELRDLEGSIRHLSRAIEINPRHEVAYFNRGLTYEELGQVEQAVEDFYQAVKIDPNDTDAKLKVLDSLLTLERFAQAEEIWQKAQETDPHHPELVWAAADLYNRWALFAEGHVDYVTALRCHRQLLEIAPDLLEISECVPYFATAEERWRAAVHGCERLLSEPGHESRERLLLDARLFAGLCHLRLRDFAAAEAVLQAYVARAPEDTHGQVLLAQVYAETARPQAALEALDTALAIKPESPELLWEKALLLEREPLRELEQAVACHEAILAISPSFRACHEPLVRLYEELGDPGRALYHLRRYELDLVDTGHYAMLEAPLQAMAGRLYLLLGWFEKALERLHTALEVAKRPAAPEIAGEAEGLDLPASNGMASPSATTADLLPVQPASGARPPAEPGHAVTPAATLHLGEVQLYLGLAYAQLERWREARIYLDKVVVDYELTEPDLAAQACQALAEVLVELGEVEEARLQLDQAAALVPGETRERLLVRLRLALAQSAWPHAEQLQAELLARSPSRDELYAAAQRLRAEIALRTSRLHQAAEALTEAQALKPFAPELARLQLELAVARGIGVEEARASLAFMEARAEAIKQLRRSEAAAALSTLETCRQRLADAGYAHEVAEAVAGELELLTAMAQAQRSDLGALLKHLRAGLERVPERIEAVRYEPALDPFTDTAEVVALLQELANRFLAEGRLVEAPRILPAASLAPSGSAPTAAAASGRHRSAKEEGEASERAPRAANEPPSSVTDEELMRDALHGIDWDSLGG